MKNFILLLISVLSIELTYAQQFPTFEWARVASESFPEIPNISGTYGSDIRVLKRDAAGNIYLSGAINKAMKFANQNIYAQDYYGNIYGHYLMKLNPTGETILWVKTLHYGDFSDFDIGNDGFLYVVSQGSGGGTFKYGDATIAGGTAYPEVPGGALFYKINASNGNMEWIKNANSPSIGSANYPFILTDNTSIYATDVLGPNANNSTTNRGYRLFKATKSGIDFDPDVYINNKSWILDKGWFAANVDPKYENFILDMKFTNDKQSIWLYLKTGDAWIDDFSGAFTDTREMILVRLDNLNNAMPTVGFKKKFTTIICPDKGDLQIDNDGNVILTGTFGTSPTRYTANSNGKAEVIFAGTTFEFPMNVSKQFIAKFSPMGAETWIKFYDVQEPYIFRSLTIDNTNNIYVCQGSYPSMTTIGSFTSINDPWWIMKLTSVGDQVYLWSNEEGGSNNSDPFIYAKNGTDVLIGTNGGGGKYGTKEIEKSSSFVLSHLRHSGVAKPFSELRKLKDINTSGDVLGLYSSNPNRFTELGGGLVFFGWMYSTSRVGHLLKTDGTEAGTISLTGTSMHIPYVNEGQEMSNASVKTSTHLYFEGSSINISNIRQTDLWKSDGTEAGTIKFKTFNSGQSDPQSNSNGIYPYDIHNMVFNNGLVFFTMSDATNSKIDLWKTDGTELGTIRLYEGCLPELATYNDFVYYFIKGSPDSYGNIPYTLRRHNGTSGGFVKNLAATSSNDTNKPKFFGVVNNQLLFTADGIIVLNGNNVNSGMELWKTNGTATGTVIVKDINPETPSNFPPGPFTSGKSSITYGTQMPSLNRKFIIYNNVLYLGADNGMNGLELWKSDGTEAGTVLVKDLSPGSFLDIHGNSNTQSTDPYGFYIFQNNILFTGAESQNAYGLGSINLYKSDGTAMGTSVLKSNVRSIGSYDYSVPMSYAVLNNTLYFTGVEQPNSLRHPTYNEPLTTTFNEIWASDGTPEGTKQLKNLVKGGVVSNPKELTVWNGSLYFTFYGAISPYVQVTTTEAELWKFTPATCTNPAPAGPLATAPTILAGYPATIKANGCPGMVRWYAGASGGSTIFTGDNYTTPILTTNTTYYLTCSVNNCESQRSPATVTVNQPDCSVLPAVPSSSGGSVVNGNSITLTATGCTEQTRWYSQASGGALLAQTPNFTSPILTSPKTYYPVCFVLGCESPRTVLDNVTILPSSGMALDFDGTDDIVTVPANIAFGSSSFTMEAYVRFDVNNRSQQIMDNSQRWMGFYYAQAGSSLNIGFVEENGNQHGAGFSFTPTPGIWYHLAGSFNHSTKEMSFYVNGELQDIQMLNFTPNQSNLGIKLGINYGVNDSYLDGRIEEARFWNIARTETQIGASYNTELSGNQNGLVFYFKFDGETTCDIQDCSPNQLHGTRLGATGTNNKPVFVNTSVALTDIACGVSSSCTLLNPCLSSLVITSPNYSSETIIRQASATSGIITATNQVTNMAKITYQSKAILLDVGFKAQPSSGGFFKAEIGGCN